MTRTLTVHFAIAAGVALLTAAQPAFAQDDSHLVRITYENVTTGQGFSPGFFAAHAPDATPLYALGQPASMPLWSVAESGNIGPFSSNAAGELGASLGDAVIAVHTPPGATRSVVISVDAAHPFISGAFMLGMTNDGFSGFTGIDAYSLTEPLTLDLRGYDAGSEINNERKGFLGALGEGNMRDPEDGVVTLHTGIRGDADAPITWNFDPSRVAVLTVTPLAPGARDAMMM